MFIGWLGAHLDGLIILIVTRRVDLRGSPKRGRSRGLALSNVPAGLLCQLIASRIYRYFTASLSICNQCTTLLDVCGFAEGCQSLRLLVDDSSASISAYR